MSAADSSTEQQRQLIELNERVKSLEKLLEEKDDEYFELSATMATIQAETKFETEKIRRETTMQLKLTKEDLRRTTQEANQAHMALARLKKHHLKYQQESLPKEMSYRKLTSQSEDVDLREVPPRTIFVPSERGTKVQYHTGQLLARHLLTQNNDVNDDISSFLNHAQFSSQLTDTNIVWQILQHSYHNTNQISEIWLRQALDWSPLSREFIRRACCVEHKDIIQPSSRIQYMSQEDYQAVSVRLLNPLWSPGMMDFPIQSNPFQTDICQRWMEEICSKPEKWYIISTLLWDCTVDDERLPWYNRIQEGLMTNWESFVKTHLPLGTTRRTHDVTVGDGMTMSKEAFIESLYLLSDVFHQPLIQRSAMAILLDVLEFEICSKNIDFQLILSILVYISLICETDIILIRTKMRTTEEDELAQSGVGVIILILMASQIQLDDRLQETDKEEHGHHEHFQMLRDHSIRILHQIYLSCRPPNNICFSSVIDEDRWHDYLGACSQVLLSSNSTKETIKLMTRLQLEELQADKEEQDDEENTR
jgi:hypothetical protein